MRLLIVRHAQSANNALFDASGSYAGRVPDPPLSDVGARQADALGRAFAGGVLPRPEAVLTSLMTRAVVTASHIADACDLPLLGHLEAFEVGGVYEGDGVVASPLPRRAHRGSGATALRALSSRLELPDGVDDTGWYRGDVELAAEAGLRAGRVLDEIVQSYPGRLVSLVCHQEFGDRLLKRALRVSDDASVFFRLANTSTSLVELPDPDHADAEVRAHWINRHDHLTAELVTR